MFRRSAKFVGGYCSTWVVALALALPMRTARADEVPAPVTTKASGGQRVLAVGFDRASVLHARVCAGEPCEIDTGSVVPLPPEAAKFATGARIRVVPAGLDRQAVVVEISDPGTGRSWAALLAAPLSGDAPVVPFSGETGFIHGIEGERSGPAIVVRDEGVYVGLFREGRDLCGRPALLSAHVLDPASLTLKAAKLQRLSAAEREAAPALPARVTEEALPPSLLEASWATSALDGAPPSALTDGKLETVWTEDRGGSGRGEFVALRAPREVPLTGFVLALPAPKGTAAVPRELYVATDGALFRVTVPEEKSAAARASASRYEITLPSAVRTSCVAVVLDRATSEDRNATVSIAEIGAKTAVGGNTDELVALLGKGGPDAEAAGALLRARGAEGYAAVAAAFPTLSADGRRVALDVLDEASCDVALPPYIEALISDSDANKLHVRSALPRCTSTAGPAFAKALATAPVARRAAIADELAAFAPALAIETLVPLLDTANRAERRAYRDAITRAAALPTSNDVVVAALSNRALTPRVTVELLRALGPRASEYGAAAGGAFAAAAADSSNFRTRYLLVAPAAELAATDATANEFVRRALTAEQRAEIRAEAARALRAGTAFVNELSAATSDPAVRVREAAVLALGSARADGARDRIVQRLKDDEWPLVRAASARALSGLSPSEPGDGALTEALSDSSADVRRAALASLGTHQVRAAASRVQDRLTDEEELPAVRATAAVVLGAICDLGSADVLTEQARRLVDPGADDSQRLIARSALSGLALLKPADLAARLAPLRSPKAPAVVRKAAEEALSVPGRCSPKKPEAPRARAK